MALHGSMGNTFKSPGWRLQIDWSAKQNLSANTSTVTARMYLVSLGGYYTINSSSTNSASISINGVRTTNTFSPNLRANQKKLILTATETVRHNDDGTKRIAIGGYADLKVTLSGTYINRVDIPGGNVTLDTIPRQSTLSANNDFRFVIGTQDVIFRINKASQSFDHRLRIYVEETLIRTVENPDSNYTFSPTAAEIKLMQASNIEKTALRARARLYTLLGDSTPWVDITGTAYIRHADPIFTDFVYVDATSSTSNITEDDQILIQNASELLVTIHPWYTAEAQAEATMKDYTVSIGSQSKVVPFTTATINVNMGTVSVSGNQTVQVTARDSRGNTTVVGKSIQILPYKPHSLTATAKRDAGFESRTVVNIKGAISLLKINGAQKNSITSAQYRTRRKGTSSWSGWSTRTQPTYGNDTYQFPTFTLTLDTDVDYEMQVRTYDRVRMIYETQSINVSTGIPPWMFEGDGNFRYRGGLIQVGNEKTIWDDGTGVTRYDGKTGTDAGVRAMKMGDNYSVYDGDTRFPTRAGAWVYFQGAKNGGDTGTDYNADFFLWKNRQKTNTDLYIGHVSNIGGVTEIGKVVTIVYEYEKQESSTKWVSCKQFSDGRMRQEVVNSLPAGTWRQMASGLWNQITYDIGYHKHFIRPPTVMAHGDKGELVGLGVRENFTDKVNFRAYSTSDILGRVEYNIIAEGYWK